MKIRNIVFSGFMASILMAGGAYATEFAGHLTTKQYVDTAYKTNATAITTHANNTDIHLSSADKTKWDKAVDDLAVETQRAIEADEANAQSILTEANRATAAEASLQNAIDGEKARAQAAEQTNAAAISANEAAITAIRNALGDVDSDDIADLARRVGEAEADIATNTNDIASNASAIETNASNITSNAANIATNAANITSNAAKIASNAAKIETNAEAIAALEGKTSCSEGLCYLTPDGAVPISTIAVFDETALDNLVPNPGA